ncbi:tetratricopeptide repeat-containing sulfotransferase family protein [Tahibacter amnicola]|uniref:Sulfotransferase n=1 Tax=Tahibacter amnicola TaxID=2976241 RepID=A0ABY6BKG7_9GAMM|nr:tetratricopeptide repeat-containing sulfotransferase family protein [Tahibacter amnicola]UXI69898.1 sulfotransferase [Tahibacter amnicola]
MSLSTEQYAAAMNDLARGIAAGRAAPALQQLIVRFETARAGVPHWVQCAEDLLRMGHLPVAGALLESGLNRWATATSLRYLYGVVLRLAGQAREAEDMFREVIAAEPLHADAPLALAFLMREQGRLTAAAEIINDVWKRLPRTRLGDLRTLRFLEECQRHAQAEELAEPILASHPEDADLLSMTGSIALVLGRFGSARRRLRAAVEKDPRQAAAWLRLAHTHKFSKSDDPDLTFLREAESRKDLTDDARTAVNFALGKALDDLGERAEAAQKFRAANALTRSRLSWEEHGWQRFVEAQMRQRISAAGLSDDRVVPVFVVGLPRSGTTLVASQLARHADTVNRSELNWIAALAANLGAAPAANALSGAANLYRAQLRQDDAPVRFYIDKNPLNFRHLGLIAAMLPNARIIHCRRDLLDTALSIWSQHFAHEDMNWAYQFSDIASYARGYQRLMQHWRQTLPIPIFELDYETLVADTPGTVSRLRQFLGAEATTAVADDAPRAAIATASVWQARQNVYASSVGRWRAYSPHLPEMTVAFG